MRRAPCLAILIVAAVVRLPNLGAGLPYINYIDEGHVVHQAAHMLRTGGWSPLSYVYPTLPLHAVTLAARAATPLYERLHGQPLAAGLSPTPYVYYDHIAPPFLIRLARLLTFAVSLGVVLLTDLLARRLAGPAAGLGAMLLAALAPALVIRSAIAGVDMWATLFVTAAFLFAHRAAAATAGRRDAALAGVMLGLAFASKYPAILFASGVALQLLLGEGSRRARAGKILLAAAAAVAAAAIAIPGLWTEPSRVFWGMRTPGSDNQSLAIGSYLHQLLVRAEWDQPLDHPELGAAFTLLVVAGSAMGLRDRCTRPAVACWLASGVIFTGFLLCFAFRPFRYLLPLVPLACAVAAIPYAAWRERIARTSWLDLAAAGAALLLFAQANADYASGRLQLVDTRVEAVNWLRDHARPEHSILVAEELAILPSELARIGGRVTSAPWADLQRLVEEEQCNYLVGARLRLPNGGVMDAREAEFVRRGYVLSRSVGREPTQPDPGFWRGNEQLVLIFQPLEKRAPVFPRVGKLRPPPHEQPAR